jgi:hypothetical protein
MAAPTDVGCSKDYWKPPDGHAVGLFRLPCCRSGGLRLLVTRRLGGPCRVRAPHKVQARRRTARADEPNLMAAALSSGGAKLSTINSDGIERVVALIHPAGLLGQCLAPRNSHPMTALSDGNACLFPRFARCQTRARNGVKSVPSSNTSTPSRFFRAATIAIVTGSRMISHPVLIAHCDTTVLNSSAVGQPSSP